MRIDYRVIALAGALAVAACGGKEEPAEDDTSTETVTETVSAFDASAYAVGWAAMPLDRTSLVEVDEKGIVMTGQNAQPQLGLAESFPVEPGVVYEVSVSFELLETGHEPETNITAWSLDAEGKQTSNKSYSVAFMSDRGNVSGIQDITARFTLSPDAVSETTPRVYGFADPEMARQVRFTTNPVRSTEGVQARVTSMSVQRVVPDMEEQGFEEEE